MRGVMRGQKYRFADDTGLEAFGMIAERFDGIGDLTFGAIF